MHADRFWSQVQKNDGDSCWLWQGSTNEKGYGRLYASSLSREVYAHRISWELHHQEIPAGAHVLHKCDNPACVNPSHLFLGTQATNMRDKVNKNRQQKGSEIRQAILSESRIEELIKEYIAGTPIEVLIETFGICRQSIYNVINGVTWQHTNGAVGAVRNPRKVDMATVRLMREKYAKGCVSYTALAKEFHMTKGNVGKIIRGELWAER